MSSIQTRFTMFKHPLKTSTNIAIVCLCVFICCVVCSIRDIPKQCFHFIILFICLGKFLCKMMLCLSYNMLRNVSVLLLLSIDLMFVHIICNEWLFKRNPNTLLIPGRICSVCSRLVLYGLEDARVSFNPFYHAMYRRYVAKVWK